MKKIERRIGKLLTVYGTHYQKVDTNRLYLNTAQGGGDLKAVDKCVQMEIKSLVEYLKSSSTEKNYVLSI